MSVSVSCLGYLLLLPLNMILRGYALCALWAWFIVPQFEVKPLTIPIALGISILAAMLTKNINLDDKKTEEQTDQKRLTGFVQSAFVAILLPLMSLGGGWVVHLFVR